MNALDLNITNYDYNDLLNIFKIDYSVENNEHIFKMNEKINYIQENCEEQIYLFFVKAKLILLTIFSLMKNKIINNSNNIEYFVQRINKINNLEKYKEFDLLNKVINDHEKENDNHKSFQLNETNYNVNAYNPSLNNKNNTNIIVNTFPNEVAPGNLNSVKRIVQLLNLNLNSCFRNNYYQSNPCDFLYMLPLEIKNVLSLRLVSIEIPNAWYLFSTIKKNNIFTIDIQVNNEKCSYDIIIPDGNYDFETLQNYLNTKYFYESEIETLMRYIKFTIDPFNLKTKFEVVNFEEDDNIRFSLNFVKDINQNIMNTFGWILGFRLANYINIEEKVCSEGLFDAGGDRYIYVCINDFQYNNNNPCTVCFDKSILNEDVLAKIPMINGKLSLVVNDNNQNLTKIRRYNGPINLSRLQIKIIDKFGTIIDLNNMDYSLTLELEILYESFNFKNVTA